MSSARNAGVFPSAYKNEQTAETTEVKTEERVTVQDAGREGRDARSQAPSRREDRFTQREDIRITEEDRHRPHQQDTRVRREENVRVYDDDRRDTRIEVDRERK
ncbi:hypothetical protein LTR56_026769 [Elasticomyces elasticus]|nr:hypothetical protein LTR56_026769 [Elasticomyces elasticus]KAK5735596.1 hypothetical protein LTS12_026418 [Elasticomyces elasticus]